MINNEQKTKIIDLFVNQKMPQEDIAKKLHITTHQLKFLFTEWNVDLRKRKRTRLKLPDREVLLKDYIRYGSTPKLAEEWHVSINTILKWMRKHKIPMKKMRNMTNKQKIDILEYHVNTIKL